MNLLQLISAELLFSKIASIYSDCSSGTVADDELYGRSLQVCEKGLLSLVDDFREGEHFILKSFALFFAKRVELRLKLCAKLWAFLDQRAEKLAFVLFVLFVVFNIDRHVPLKTI